MERFIDWYVSEQVGLGVFSDVTAKNRAVELRHMARHIPADPTEVTTASLRAWISSGNPAPTTVRTRRAVALAFFDWLVDSDVIVKNPAKRVPRPTIGQPPPRFLERDEVERLMRLDLPPRNRAIIVAMVSMGLRRIEIVRAERGDYTGVTLAVRGKGHRGLVSRTLPVPTVARDAIDAWLRVSPSSGYLFPAASGGQLAGEHLSRVVSGILRDAGVKRRSLDGISAHALRHTFAQTLVDNGAALRKVQQAMGHTAQATTEIYLRRVETGLAEMMESPYADGGGPVAA